MRPTAFVRRYTYANPDLIVFSTSRIDAEPGDLVVVTIAPLRPGEWGDRMAHIIRRVPARRYWRFTLQRPMRIYLGVESGEPVWVAVSRVEPFKPPVPLIAEYRSVRLGDRKSVLRISKSYLDPVLRAAGATPDRLLVAVNHPEGPVVLDAEARPVAGREYRIIARDAPELGPARAYTVIAPAPPGADADALATYLYRLVE